MSYSKLDINVNRVGNMGKIYIYHNLPKGGAKETLGQLTDYLDSKKLAYTILTGTKDRPTNIFHYLYIAIFKNLIHDLVISRQIHKEDKLIIFQSWLIKTPYISILCNPLKKIYVCHEPPREYYDNDYISSKNIKEKVVDFIRLPIKYIDKLNAKYSNALFVANSKESYKRIFQAYNVKSVVVYPGISIQINKQEFVRNNVHKKTVISVGSIVKPKRFDFLIRVIGKISKINRPNLKIIGYNHNKNCLNNVIELANKLEVNLEIIEDATKNRLLNEYAKSDIFCFAPINEPFGIAVIEAICTGLPVIVYKRGSGFAEVINDKNGALMDTLDTDQWKDKILYYLNNQKHLMETRKYNLAFGKRFEKSDYGEKLVNLLQ